MTTGDSLNWTKVGLKVGKHITKNTVINEFELD